MKKIVIVTFLIAIPALLAANESALAEQYFKLTGRHNDFIPRLFNFALLVGLLYYLLANPIKEFLQKRSESIANELQEIESKKEAAKKAKEEAASSLEAAKAKAQEIVEDAKKEAALLKEKIAKATEDELIAMQKAFEQKCEIEERKAIRETTLKTLNENISLEDIPLDAQKILNIVTKEVA